MSICNDPRCPICHPKRQEESEEEKHDCAECWRFFQKKAEAIVAIDDPITRNRRIIFANHCTVTGANAQIERFSKQPLANLANAEERMEFVRRAANRFHALLRDPLQSKFVENSLFVIAHGNPS
jgi:hypothetical protein